MDQTIRGVRGRSLISAAALVAVVAIGHWGPAGLAQTRRAMTLVDLISYTRLGDPQLSRDGTRLLYMLSQTDWKSDTRTPHLWRQDVGGGAPVQLTFGDGEFSPRWSPDG